MKILVLSDSHGRVDAMEEAVRLEQPDMIMHLGDLVRDADALGARCPGIPLVRVPGNCDGSSRLAGVLLYRVGGVPILLCHGHQYSVKSGYYRISLAARQEGAEVLLFGHTHVQYCEQYDGLWMLNPGACGQGGFLRYGLVTVEDGHAHCCTVSEKQNPKGADAL